MDGMEGLSDPAASAQPQQAAPAPVQAAPQAQPPHAGLSAYISKLALGIDAFATSAATGGREGGVQEVQAVQQRDAEMKLKQQAAQDAAKESDVRIKHTQALTNASIAQTQMLLHDAPLDYQNKVLEHNKNLADFLTNTMHIPSAFVVPMLEGQGTDEHMAAINGKASGDLVNNTAIPVHDSKFAGSGKSVGFSFDQLKKTNLTGEQMGPTLASLQGQVDLAKGYLGADDPAVKVAQGKLDLFKGADTVNGWDFYNFNQQTQAQLMSKVSNKQAITKFEGEQADLKEKAQKTDPLFKMENDPGEMSGEKSAAAIPLLQNKLTAPGTSPEDKVRATRLLSQAKSAHAMFQQDQIQKANAEQQSKQGDPKQAGAMLENGTLTLADMKTRGMTPKFIMDATQAAQAINPKYNPADEVIAEQVAKSPEASKFFGSANSLISKGGTLDQVQTAGAKLPDHKWPIFNKLDDAKNYATGHPEVAAYLQSALGAADDYAKVMGGGTGTEGMQLHILNGLTAAQNQEQRTAVIGSMKGAVNSQVESRIGNNKFLKRAYGYALPGAQENAAPAFNPATDFKPIK